MNLKLKVTTFSIVLILFNLLSTGQVVKKVEPPFWWTGMQNEQLQLMIYGEQIANYDVEIDRDGYLQSVERVENENYIFLNLIIPEETKPDRLKIDFKSDGKTIESIQYELKERKKSKTTQQGFDQSDVIYLLMPDRFANGDPNNDQSEEMIEKLNRKDHNGRHGGDIQGIIDHLDYFNDFGVTALWVNPLLENNQEKYTYHGYAITDFYKIDPRHGTNDLYQKFVEKAHDKDLKVIMDMVLNHCGINHWWINDLPEADWIHQFDEFTRSNYRTPVLLDPYASELDKKLQQTGWFDVNMPDLNQQNKYLANYFIQNTIWWIEFSGIDGIRLDTQPYADKDMVANWAQAIFTEYPDFMILGEAWLQKIPITAYWQKSSRNFDGYSSNIPVITDFPLHYAITQAFHEEQTWTDGMAKLYYVLAQDFMYENPENTLVFLDNHDVNRIYSNLNRSMDKLKMAIAFQLTTRGIPSVYYGTELLMEGFEHEPHGKMRADFPGGWKDDKTNAFTSEGRTDDQNEIFNYYSKILQWRKSKDVIHSGKLIHFIPEHNVYVYFRTNDKETVMVMLNNNERAEKINTKKFAEILRNYSEGTEIITGEKLPNLENIEIPKKSAMIIELK